MSQMEKEGFGEEFSICSSFCLGGIRGGHHWYSISYHCDILYLCDIMWIMQNESAKLGLNQVLLIRFALSTLYRIGIVYHNDMIYYTSDVRPEFPPNKKRSKWKIPPQTPPFPFATSEFKNK